MYVTGDTIIRFATVLGAIRYAWSPALPQLSLDGAAEGTAGGNREHQKEQCVICYGLLATLDGLKQLGANGNVSDAYQRLEKHLNQSAHE